MSLVTVVAMIHSPCLAVGQGIMETSESVPCDDPCAVDQVSCGLDSGMRES